jgi:hypothetical protein
MREPVPHDQSTVRWHPPPAAFQLAPLGEGDRCGRGTPQAGRRRWDQNTPRLIARIQAGTALPSGWNRCHAERQVPPDQGRSPAVPPAGRADACAPVIAAPTRVRTPSPHRATGTARRYRGQAPQHQGSWPTSDRTGQRRRWSWRGPGVDVHGAGRRRSGRCDAWGRPSSACRGGRRGHRGRRYGPPGGRPGR